MSDCRIPNDCRWPVCACPAVNPDDQPFVVMGPGKHMIRTRPSPKPPGDDSGERVHEPGCGLDRDHAGNCMVEGEPVLLRRPTSGERVTLPEHFAIEDAQWTVDAVGDAVKRLAGVDDGSRWYPPPYRSLILLRRDDLIALLDGRPSPVPERDSGAEDQGASADASAELPRTASDIMRPEHIRIRRELAAQIVALLAEPENPDVGWGIYYDLLRAAFPTEEDKRRIAERFAAASEASKAKDESLARAVPSESATEEAKPYNPHAVIGEPGARDMTMEG